MVSHPRALPGLPAKLAECSVLFTPMLKSSWGPSLNSPESKAEKKKERKGMKHLPFVFRVFLFLVLSKLWENQWSQRSSNVHDKFCSTSGYGTIGLLWKISPVLCFFLSSTTKKEKIKIGICFFNFKCLKSFHLENATQNCKACGCTGNTFAF